MDVTIPSWAILIMGAIFLPWLIWLTKQVNANEKDIAINTATDGHVADELKKIYSAIDEQREDSNKRFDRMENKFDTLLSPMLRHFLVTSKIQ
jgi:hypothetical protein